MLVVHGLWSPAAGFCFWAEDALVIPPSSPSPRRGLAAHPFAGAPEVVGSVLGVGSAGGAAGQAGEDGELILLLPSVASRPVPSPAARVGAAVRRSRAAPRLRPWLVPVVRLPAATAVDVLLAGLPGGSEAEDGRGVITGGAWAWLAAVADTAVELVGAGRALPRIVSAGGGEAQAWWWPVPAAGDDTRLRALAGGIPPLCRAETDAGGNEPAQAGEALLTGALGAMVDAVVRSALGGCRLVPARRGRAP
ncbi:MAG: hypothetical protein ACRDY7_07245, partial [Acidimicrobiia bacterium]